MTENDYVKRKLNTLKLHGFEIFEQEWGTFIDGSRKRIDAVVKAPFKNAYFGIEFKHDENSSFNHRANHLKQAIDYHYTKWDNFGYLYILLCPDPFEIYSKNNSIVGSDGQFMYRFLTQFNIGALDITKFGLTILLGGSIMDRRWSEYEGVKYKGERGNYKTPLK